MRLGMVYEVEYEVLRTVSSFDTAPYILILGHTQLVDLREAHSSYSHGIIASICSSLSFPSRFLRLDPTVVPRPFPAITKRLHLCDALSVAACCQHERSILLSCILSNLYVRNNSRSSWYSQLQV